MVAAAAGCSSAKPPVVTGPLDTAPNRSSVSGLQVKLTRVALVKPVTAMASRAGTDDLYVATQGGVVRALHATPPATAGAAPAFTMVDTPVLDITTLTDGGGERGLLGLAFGPTAGTDQKLFVYYTGLDGRVTVDEYAMRGEVADPASRRNLVSLTHDRANHNGGQLTFGPDGFLYLGVGDGGGGGDPDHNGQNPRTPYGKILRIDPAHPADGRPYGIPAGNPFADGRDGAPEVWAYGLRNPWRFSFDTRSGDLWIGDVGQDRIEEVDLLPATAGRDAGRGANLGWNQMEGSEPFEDGSLPAGAIGPITELTHDDGACSVIGGFVSHGPDVALEGVYVYADLCAGEIRGLLARDGRKLDDRPLGASLPSGSISSFGQAHDGRLYVLSLSGEVFRIDTA